MLMPLHTGLIAGAPLLDAYILSAFCHSVVFVNRVHSSCIIDICYFNPMLDLVPVAELECSLKSRD